MPDPERIKKIREYRASAKRRREAGDEEDAAWFDAQAEKELEALRTEEAKRPFQGYQPDRMSRAADWEERKLGLWGGSREKKAVPQPPEQPAPPPEEPPEQRPSRSARELYPDVPLDWDDRTDDEIRFRCKASKGQAQGCPDAENFIRARKLEKPDAAGVIRQSSPLASRRGRPGPSMG